MHRKLQIAVSSSDEEPRLQAEDVQHPQPERLKRSEMDGLDCSLWAELCMAKAEGDLCGEGSDQLVLLSDSSFVADSNLYKSLKLKADKSVVFDKKSLLKRRTAIRLATWVAAAVAAGILLFAVLQSVEVEMPNTTAVVHSGSAQNAAGGIDTPSMSQSAEVANKIEVALAAEEKVSASKTKRQEAAAENFSAPAASVDSVKAAQPLVEERPRKASFPMLALLPEQPKVAMKNSDGILVVQPMAQVEAVDSEEDVGGKEAESPSLLHSLVNAGIITSSASSSKDLASTAYGKLALLSEKGIVALNKLLDKETVVVKEYDSSGNLTLYAVESSTFKFQKKYNE